MRIDIGGKSCSSGSGSGSGSGSEWPPEGPFAAMNVAGGFFWRPVGFSRRNFVRARPRPYLRSECFCLDSWSGMDVAG